VIYRKGDYQTAANLFEAILHNCSFAQILTKATNPLTFIE
jgi:hypothetical protein